jgi:hypothetical protein
LTQHIVRSAAVMDRVQRLNRGAAGTGNYSGSGPAAGTTAPDSPGRPPSASGFRLGPSNSALCAVKQTSKLFLFLASMCVLSTLCVLSILHYREAAPESFMVSAVRESTQKETQNFLAVFGWNSRGFFC